MYQVSQLMSTPEASSSGAEKEHLGERLRKCIFPSFAGDFLDGDSSFECCSTDPLTGSHFTCRRSPRLLTNGYYIWTEDSFLCDKDGNVTLSPSQTSVIYKENLVSASKSWLRGRIFGDASSSPSEDIWFEGLRRLDTYHCDENRGDLDCSSLAGDWALEEPRAELPAASSRRYSASLSPRGISHDSPLQSQLTASERFHKNTLDHSKTSLLQEVSFQAILLAACFIFSACARCFLGGIFTSVFNCSLVVTIAYVVKSLFLSVTSYFKARSCAG
ncbi:PREDICTED: transmembrane protein 71 [Chrysochloris asiatica]|uniref:Transmembrane protein 71 n=1 Tax=Chrysochloris asiatica TaxID=185453 RepID=A0A9B0T3Q9_CHRAS|nr:PREDICTED: transmembrane protein 71 [Chrysochloris asiatica]